MRALHFGFSAALLALAFTACSDSSDENNPTTQNAGGSGGSSAGGSGGSSAGGSGGSSTAGSGGSSAGGNGGSSEDAAGEPAAAMCTLPASLGSQECDACLTTSCCTPIEACAADSSCSAVITCVSACVDDPDPMGCAGTCFGNDGPPPAFLEIQDCLLEKCVDACAGGS